MSKKEQMEAEFSAKLASVNAHFDDLEQMQADTTKLAMERLHNMRQAALDDLSTEYGIPLKKDLGLADSKTIASPPGIPAE